MLFSIVYQTVEFERGVWKSAEGCYSNHSARKCLCTLPVQITLQVLDDVGKSVMVQLKAYYFQLPEREVHNEGGQRSESVLRQGVGAVVCALGGG